MTLILVLEPDFGHEDDAQAILDTVRDLPGVAAADLIPDDFVDSLRRNRLSLAFYEAVSNVAASHLDAMTAFDPDTGRLTTPL